MRTIVGINPDADHPTKPLLETPPRRRRLPPPGPSIFALAVSTGLLMVFVISRTSVVSAGFDPYGFGLIGQSIAKGHGFADQAILFERKAPLYPGLIGGIYALFGVHPYLVLVLQCFIFAGTCALVFDLGRSVFNERTGVVAGLICALHPMMLNYIDYLHLETLLTFLVTLMIWLMVRFYKRPTVRNGILIGVVAGLAALTKSVVLLYPGVFVIGIVLATRAARRRGDDKPQPWAALGIILVAFCLTLLPWTIRMYKATGGHFVPVSTGTSDAFLRGFIFSRTQFITLQQPPYTDAENESDAYFRSLARAAGATWQKNDWQTDQILNHEAERRLIAQPGQVVRKTAIGMLTFWYELTSLKNSLLALVLAIGGWVLAWIGWRRARRERLPSWLLILPILFLNVELALLLALGRYSVPILPALFVLAAYGVDTILDHRKVSRA